MATKCDFCFCVKLCRIACGNSFTKARTLDLNLSCAILSPRFKSSSSLLAFENGIVFVVCEVNILSLSLSLSLTLCVHSLSRSYLLIRLGNAHVILPKVRLQ